MQRDICLLITVDRYTYIYCHLLRENMLRVACLERNDRRKLAISAPEYVISFKFNE